MSPRAERVGLAAVIVAGLALYWPAMHAGFLADDLFQISMFEGLFGDHSPFGLYAFGRNDPAATAEHVARGSLPWWTVSHWRFTMLRPLSSLLIALDHTIFPRGAFAHHIHSGLWFAATLVATHVALRRATTPVIALVAVAFFAVDETFAWMVAWLANRCSLVSMVFAMLALAVHLRAAAGTPTRADRLKELVLWGFAFAGGEYAACGVAYLVAYELVAGQGTARARVAALVPGLVPLVVFAAFYIGYDCGVYGATTYIDPFDDPLVFVRTAGERIPRMAGEVWLGMLGESERFWIRYESIGLSELVMPDDGADLFTQAWRHARFAAFSIVVTVIPTWLLARPFLEHKERAAMRWIALGSVLSLVPVAAIPPATRSLLLSNLGAAVFVGTVCVGAARAWRDRAPILRRLGVAAAAGFFAVLHSGLEASHAREQLAALRGAQLAYAQFYGNPPFQELDTEGKHVVVIATPGLVTGIHGISMLNILGHPLPASWHVLAMGRRPYIVRRLGPRSLELQAIASAMHIGPQEALFRSPLEPMAVGQRVDASVFAARVVHVRDHEGPDAVVFRFRRALEHESLVFLEVGPDGLHPFALPAVGKAVAVKPPMLPSAEPR